VDLRLRRLRDPGFTPSVPIPDMRTSAGGLAATMGLFTNVRFQVVGGIDRYLFDHSNYLFSYLALSTAFRAASTWIGQPTRLHLQARPRGPRCRPVWPAGAALRADARRARTCGDAAPWPAVSPLRDHQLCMVQLWRARVCLTRCPATTCSSTAWVGGEQLSGASGCLRPSAAPAHLCSEK